MKTEDKQDYVCTTKASDWASWDWFQDYHRYSDGYKSGTIPEPKIDYGSGPLPIEVGVQFGKWVLETPEIRDIVYRRFVIGDYDNTLEGNLLGFAKTYFLRKIHIRGFSSFLAICWPPLAKILTGQMDSVESAEYRAALLKSVWAFTSEHDQQT